MLTVYLNEDYGRVQFTATHDSYDTPPALPVFEPPPKRPKKESLAESITNAAVAITKAVNPSTFDAQQSPIPTSSH